MLQRPKVGETEEDLLKQEEEFLKQSGKAPTQKPKSERDPGESRSSASPGVVGEVMERYQRLPCAPSHGSEAKTNGFPALFEIDPEITTKKEKKSLFALHIEKSKKIAKAKKKESKMTKESGAPDLSTGETGQNAGSGMNQEDTAIAGGSAEQPKLSDDDKKSIHAENLNKLSAMSEADILEAQKNLQETLDPKLISVLKNRSKSKKNAGMKKKPPPQEVGAKDANNLCKERKIKEIVRGYVGDKWVNMDFIEKEKLEWVGDIPGSDSLQPGQSYSARFNFKGELQPFRTEIDVTNALYHHGDEPERPGYTIQELYQLSRSTVRQQRILALNTLANIIHKSKLGYYDLCFDGHLLHKLLDADLFFLLRFSIDDNKLVPSTLNCLRMLIYNDSDEYCLDRLLSTTDDDLQPLFYDKTEMKREEERELTDSQLIHLDLIKGVMRTDLLLRISYILNHLPCQRETIANAILCFIRVARHSPDGCDKVARTPQLLHFVYSVINCKAPVYQGVKLFRVLTGQSRDAAVQIISRYPLNFLMTFLDLDSMSKISQKEFYLLKLECIYLWRNFIRCGFMKDDFTRWTPCFVRILRFYAEKVDIYADSDFDFEFFPALISMLRLCVREKLPIDNNYPATVYICLEKWLNQLLQSQKFTYAAMKTLGSCFGFCIDYFEIFGSDGRGFSFVRKLNKMVTTLIGSPCFERMASNLVDYSHILTATVINRDPSNLPSVCSVYENGDDFVRIVNNQSTLPFFMYFVKYLEFNHAVLNESNNNIELFNNHPAIRKYVAEIMKLEKNTGNWFERYEITLLADILQLFFISNDRLGLPLGFRLMPMIRIDEEDFVFVTTILLDKKNWGTSEEYFDSLGDIYLDRLYRPELRIGYALRYRSELAGEEWTYKVLTRFRGKNAVTEVKKALKFLTKLTWTEPHLLRRVTFTARYYHLCSVFLTDCNVFNEDIQGEMRCNFQCILQNREKVDLTQKVEDNKSFYDLYVELITQYAGVSYGMHIFAEFVLFPLQNRFNVSFRKLLWFEYLHVLRVITVPHPSPRFIDIEEFVEPHETDESLLVAYLNSVSSSVISKQKNPFVYYLAVSNINNYMKNASPDATLYKFLSRRIRFTMSERVRQDLTSW